MAHPNTEFMREYLDCWVTGKVDKALGMIADDVVTQFPGKSLIAGVYHGKNAFMELGKKMNSFGQLKVMKFHDILAKDDRAVVLAKERFQREGKSTIVDRAVEYRIRDGKIIGIRWYESDQYAVDEFFK